MAPPRTCLVATEKLIAVILSVCFCSFALLWTCLVAALIINKAHSPSNLQSAVNLLDSCLEFDEDNQVPGSCRVAILGLLNKWDSSVFQSNFILVSEDFWSLTYGPLRFKIGKGPLLGSHSWEAIYLIRQTFIPINHPLTLVQVNYVGCLKVFFMKGIPRVP